MKECHEGNAMKEQNGVKNIYKVAFKISSFIKGIDDGYRLIISFMISFEQKFYQALSRKICQMSWWKGEEDTFRQ